jgi:hypothetical protein
MVRPWARSKLRVAHEGGGRPPLIEIRVKLAIVADMVCFRTKIPAADRRVSREPSSDIPPRDRGKRCGQGSSGTGALTTRGFLRCRFNLDPGGRATPTPPGASDVNNPHQRRDRNGQGSRGAPASLIVARVQETPHRGQLRSHPSDLLQVLQTSSQGEHWNA